MRMFYYVYFSENQVYNYNYHGYSANNLLDTRGPANVYYFASFTLSIDAIAYCDFLNSSREKA
jgi:hypothetical protein